MGLGGNQVLDALRLLQGVETLRGGIGVEAQDPGLGLKSAVQALVWMLPSSQSEAAIPSRSGLPSALPQVADLGFAEIGPGPEGLQ